VCCAPLFFVDVFRPLTCDVTEEVILLRFTKELVVISMMLLSIAAGSASGQIAKIAVGNAGIS